jgi:hypothetical protein
LVNQFFDLSGKLYIDILQDVQKKFK